GYIGGSWYDAGYGIAVDRWGNAYVTGDTDSDASTFPVAVGPGLSYNGGFEDAYVAKVKADGTGLAYCGYIGGSEEDIGFAIAVDRWGNAYVAGATDSDASTFPVAVGPDLSYNGSADVFVAKIHDITTDPADFDGDGVPDRVEQGPDGADPGYDGNGDGTPDWRQRNVISIPSVGQSGEYGYTTVAVAPGRHLAHLRTSRAADVPPPEGVSFPYGLFSFAIGGLAQGGAATATIHLPDRPPQSYYKFGKTPEHRDDHWYEFSYDGETGAEAVGNTVVLHFVDGKRGDHDLEENGWITDPGGPAAIERREALYFPYLVASGAERTEFGIINTKDDAAAATIAYYGENGDPIAAVALTLGPRGKAVVSAESIPPNSASAVVSGTGALVGYTRYVNTRGQRCAWTAAAGLQKFLFVPHAAIDAAWATGLCLFNPADAAAEVTLTYDTGGAGRLTLGAKSRRFLWLAETEPVSTVSATSPISVVEVLESLSPGGDRAALLLGDRNLPSLPVPSILHGPGEYTGIGLNSYRSGTVTVLGYGDAGRVAEVTFGTRALGDQGTRGKAAVNLSGMLGETSLWARISGTADITTPAGTPLLHFQGLALYGTEANGIGSVSLNALKFKVGFIGILSTGPETAVVLLNPNAADAVAQVTAYNAAGEALISGSLRIAAGKVWTGTATALFDGASLAGATHIRIASDTELAGFETLSADGRMEMLPVLAVD
ncbi:MAG: choice-of-anchor U domain-containing protein, partial [Syntrophales bacterium]